MKQLTPNELRYNNYVYEKYWSNSKGEYLLEVIKLNGVLETHISCFEGSAYNYDDLEPIPLDEQWLENLGWEKHSDHLDRSTYRITIKNTEYRFVLNEWLPKDKPACGSLGIYSEEFECEITGVKEEEFAQYFAWSIKYVHELQNCIHSITGQELQIKE